MDCLLILQPAVVRHGSYKFILFVDFLLAQRQLFHPSSLAAELHCCPIVPFDSKCFALVVLAPSLSFGRIVEDEL